MTDRTGNMVITKYFRKVPQNSSNRQVTLPISLQEKKKQEWKEIVKEAKSNVIVIHSDSDEDVVTLNPPNTQWKKIVPKENSVLLEPIIILSDDDDDQNIMPEQNEVEDFLKKRIPQIKKEIATANETNEINIPIDNDVPKAVLKKTPVNHMKDETSLAIKNIFEKENTLKNNMNSQEDARETAKHFHQTLTTPHVNQINQNFHHQHDSRKKVESWLQSCNNSFSQVPLANTNNSYTIKIQDTNANPSQQPMLKSFSPIEMLPQLSPSNKNASYGPLSNNYTKQNSVLNTPNSQMEIKVKSVSTTNLSPLKTFAMRQEENVSLIQKKEKESTCNSDSRKDPNIPMQSFNAVDQRIEIPNDVQIARGTKPQHPVNTPSSFEENANRGVNLHNLSYPKKAPPLEIITLCPTKLQKEADALNRTLSKLKELSNKPFANHDQKAAENFKPLTINNDFCNKNVPTNSPSQDNIQKRISISNNVSTNNKTPPKSVKQLFPTENLVTHPDISSSKNTFSKPPICAATNSPTKDQGSIPLKHATSSVAKQNTEICNKNKDTSDTVSKSKPIPQVNKTNNFKDTGNENIETSEKPKDLPIKTIVDINDNIEIEGPSPQINQTISPMEEIEDPIDDSIVEAERPSLFDIVEFFEEKDSVPESDNESLFDSQNDSLKPDTPTATPKKIMNVFNEVKQKDEDSKSSSQFNKLLNDSQMDCEDDNSFDVSSSQKSKKKRSIVPSKRRSLFEKITADNDSDDEIILSQNSLASVHSNGETNKMLKELNDTHISSMQIVTPRKQPRYSLNVPKDICSPVKMTSGKDLNKACKQSISSLNGLYLEHHKESKLNKVEEELMKDIKCGGMAFFMNQPDSAFNENSDVDDPEKENIEKMKLLMTQNMEKEKEEKNCLEIFVTENEPHIVPNLTEFVTKYVLCKITRFEEKFIKSCTYDLTQRQMATVDSLLSKTYLNVAFYKWVLRLIPFHKKSEKLSEMLILKLQRKTPMTPPYDYTDFRESFVFCGISAKLLPPEKATVKIEPQNSDSLTSTSYCDQDKSSSFRVEAVLHMFQLLMSYIRLFPTSMTLSEISDLLTMCLLSFADPLFLSVKCNLTLCLEGIASAIVEWDDLQWALTSKILQYIPELVIIVSICDTLLLTGDEQLKSLARCLAISTIRAHVKPNIVQMNSEQFLKDVVSLSSKITPLNIKNKLIANGNMETRMANKFSYLYFNSLLDMLRICLTVPSRQAERIELLQKVHGNLQLTYRRILPLTLIQSQSKCKMMFLMKHLSFEVQSFAKPSKTASIFKYLRSGPVEENMVSSQESTGEDLLADIETEVALEEMDETTAHVKAEDDLMHAHQKRKHSQSTGADSPLRKILKYEDNMKLF